MKLSSALLLLASVTVAAATVDLCCVTLAHSGEAAFELALQELGFPPGDDPKTIGVECILPNDPCEFFEVMCDSTVLDGTVGINCVKCQG
ncbi:hypothetical protein C8R45DRAFT_1099470 [Mycena sanguinolenta]|nr:hypothetical protein C8R45DRAFT_1099470 [Mycena sanguinolenta]